MVDGLAEDFAADETGGAGDDYFHILSGRVK